MTTSFYFFGECRILIERSLVALWIMKSMNTHIRAWGDTRGILRGDENVLNSIGRSRCVNQHLHTNTSVDSIHEHIELIQTMSKKKNYVSIKGLIRTSNSRMHCHSSNTHHRRVLAIDSQRASSIQMVEKDRSPPERDFGSLSRATSAFPEF